MRRRWAVLQALAHAARLLAHRPSEVIPGSRRKSRNLKRGMMRRVDAKALLHSYRATSTFDMVGSSNQSDTLNHLGGLSGHWVVAM